MNRSRKFLEKLLNSEISKGNPPSKELLENLNGPRDVSFFDCDGNDLYIAVDNWEYPRCANVLNSSDNEVLAKVKIPNSDIQRPEIIAGELTPEEERKTVEILNSKFCSVPCWKSIRCCLEPRSTFELH